MTLTRCDWAPQNDALYCDYHDNEWGNPEFDAQKLFELLCLEGQQSGLSWITVLKKREHYRHFFYDFDAQKIVDNFNIDDLLQQKGLIRHRLKLDAIYQNAIAFLQMQQNNDDFSHFIWSFVGGKPIINQVKTREDIPTQTEISRNLSKALKKKGFKFIGPTTCYAFMQAAGLVNDHFLSCYKRKNLK